MVIKDANFTINANLFKRGDVRFIFDAKPDSWAFRFGNLPALRGIDKSSPLYRITDLNGFFIFSTVSDQINPYGERTTTMIVRGLNYISNIFLRKSNNELLTLASILHSGPEDFLVLSGPVDQSSFNLAMDLPQEHSLSG